MVPARTQRFGKLLALYAVDFGRNMTYEITIKVND